VGTTSLFFVLLFIELIVLFIWFKIDHIESELAELNRTMTRILDIKLKEVEKMNLKR